MLRVKSPVGMPKQHSIPFLCITKNCSLACVLENQTAYISWLTAHAEVLNDTVKFILLWFCKKPVSSSC